MTQPQRIELIQRREHGQKCPGCGYRVTNLYSLGENEAEELAVCGDCTLQHINSTDRYGIIDTELTP